MGTVRKTITVANQPIQRHKAELKTIRSALEDGESSGPPRPFNPDAFKQRMLLVRGVNPHRKNYSAPGKCPNGNAPGVFTVLIAKLLRISLMPGNFNKCPVTKRS